MKIYVTEIPATDRGEFFVIHVTEKFGSLSSWQSPLLFRGMFCKFTRHLLSFHHNQYV